MVKFNFDDTNAYGGVGKFGGKSAPSALPKLTLKDLKDLAFKYKVETACAGAVLVTIVIIWPFCAIQMGKISVLANDIQVMTDKEKPIQDVDNLSKEAKTLLDGVPESLPENRFITQLTSLANKRNVTVTAISPPASKDNGFFGRISTQLSCSVNGFKNALLFINDIEQAPYALKVDSWSVRPSSLPDAKGPGDDSVKLDMTVIVSSIELLGK